MVYKWLEMVKMIYMVTLSSYDTWLYPFEWFIKYRKILYVNGLAVCLSVCLSVCHVDNSRRAYPIFTKLGTRALWPTTVDKFVNGPYRCLSSISPHKSSMCFFEFFLKFSEIDGGVGEYLLDHPLTLFKVIQCHSRSNGQKWSATV